ncbi:MAG: transglutaminase family protein [Rhizobiaceae bacterium]|nr:transglutaminase family protein [Rhizobiaceae bacterium]
MLYDIKLRMSYDYERPANAGRHLLHLLPLNLPGEQRVLAGHLGANPAPQERLDRADFFGNAATELFYRAPHRSIDFTVKARVSRTCATPDIDGSPTLARLREEVVAQRSLGPASPVHFLADSPWIVRDEAMTAYARETLAPGMSAYAAVRALGERIHADFTYDGEATEVDTTPREAFAKRRGVCQDFAQVMIACLRGVGVPAGYVSGFLRTIPPPGRARLEGADAMHAWVRAWCGDRLGWVEYDPTNALAVAADHIVVARGRDYGDVAPVKGVMRIAGGQEISQAVDVVPLPEQ